MKLSEVIENSKFILGALENSKGKLDRKLINKSIEALKILIVIVGQLNGAIKELRFKIALVERGIIDYKESSLKIKSKYKLKYNEAIGRLKGFKEILDRLERR